MKKLMHKDPLKRPALMEIKAHSFFNGLLNPDAKPFNKEWHSDIATLFSIQPPIIPIANNRQSNFDPEHLKLPVRLTHESDLYSNTIRKRAHSTETKR